MEQQPEAGNSKLTLRVVSENSGASAPPNEQRPSAMSPNESGSSSPAVPRATGPRTLQGKERSKHNALKHRIFSKVLLLKTESRSEFDSLLNGLRADLRPVGTLEETLVEKLAMLIWRQRRLIVAETGEIRKSTEFLEWDEDSRLEEAADQIVEEQAASRIVEAENAKKGISDPLLRKDSGLIRYIANPKILERCVELLQELHENIKTDGFDPDQDQQILDKLYGTDEHLQQTLKEEYAAWSETADCSEKERQKNHYASRKQCLANVCNEIEYEIERLGTYDRARKQVASAKTESGKLCGSVPHLPDVDRLIRYETSIDRAFDRTLNQLERAQSLRRGQPVLPAIKVDLSK